MAAETTLRIGGAGCSDLLRLATPAANQAKAGKTHPEQPQRGGFWHRTWLPGDEVGSFSRAERERGARDGRSRRHARHVNHESRGLIQERIVRLVAGN